jgi:hypothetical protein
MRTDFNLDYEIEKYLDEQVDEYVPFRKFLKKKGITLAEARQCVTEFRNEFKRLLSEYSIGINNLVTTCYDLTKLITQQPDNPDLQYLYLCIMTDSGVLNMNNDATEEQVIRNYLRQAESIRELSGFFKIQYEDNRKLHELRRYLKEPIAMKNIDCSDELDFLYELTIQHTFLRESMENPIYRDNLDGLITYINSDKRLQSVKPYIIFAVLSRKHGMMQNRENFMPNIRNVFRYQSYNILSDNGKNFNNYQSYLELYDNLHSFYMDDKITDTGMCDFCFANLSPLSEWYYMNCEPNEDIPMNLKIKIMSMMPDSFPMIMSYDDYGKLDEYEIQLYGDAEEKLKNKMLDVVNQFLKI